MRLKLGVAVVKRPQKTWLYFRARRYAEAQGFYPSKSISQDAPTLSPDAIKHLDLMILNKIKLLQFGTPLKNARFLTDNFLREGFGAVIGRLTKALACGYLYNRTVLFGNSHLRYDFPYEPLSSHCLEDIKEYKKAPAKWLRPARDRCLTDLNEYDSGVTEFNFLPQKEKVVHNYRYGPLFYLDPYFSLGPPLLQRLNFVHPAVLPHSLAYIQGLILDGFLRLKPKYEAHLEERRKSMGFKSPVIGVHIRKGDAEPKRRFLPRQIYFETVERVADETGIRTVFVSTDSDKIIRQLPKHSGLEFIYDDQEKRYNTYIAGMLGEQPSLKQQETMTAVKNIYLLGACHRIIGGPSLWVSAAGGIAYFRRKEFVLTYI